MRALSGSSAVLAIVVAALCGCKSPTVNIATKQGATPRPVTLTMAELVSHTNDDAKEKDSGIYVYVRTKSKATVLASVEDADRSEQETSKYEPGSDHRLRLSLTSPGSTKEDCRKFLVTVKLKSNADDKWKFDGSVVL